MILKLLSYAVLSGVLYGALAARSAQTPADTLFASWLHPTSFEETAEFLALWVALAILYGLSIRTVSGRDGRALFAFVFVTSALFRAFVMMGSGFDQSSPTVFLDSGNPIDWLSQSLASANAGQSILFPDVSLQRWLASAADLAALALAPGLLRASGLPSGLALIHGWNPLVIKEVAGSGRVDILALFLLLVSLRLAQARWSSAAAVTYGLSLSGPLMIAASLPVMARALGTRVLLALALGVGAWFYLSPSDGASAILGYPPEDFLGGSLTPAIVSLSRVFVTRQVVFPIGVACALFLLALFATARLSRDLGKLPQLVLFALASATFLAPQVLPWRFSALAYLAAFSRNRGFVMFTLTAPLSYLALGDGDWNFWLGFTQYFPAYASLVFIWLGGKE